MASPNDNIRRLYENGLKHFSLPDFNTFQQDMKDEQKRRRFYTNMQQAYSLPDFDTFSKDIGAVTVEAPAPAQPASTPASTPQTVQPVKDNTAQQAAVQPATPAAPSQPAKQHWQPSEVQKAHFQHQMDEANRRLQQTIDEGQQRKEGIKKGNAPGAFMGSREWNPTTGQFETVYYTQQGEKVSSQMEKSRKDRAYNEWWETNTEAGKRSRENRLQRNFDAELATLWQRHDPAEGESAAQKAWSDALGRQKADAERISSDVYKSRGNAMADAAFLGGRENHIMNAAENRHRQQVAHLTNFDLDRLMNDSWNNLGEEGQQAVIDDCLSMLKKRYPGQDELVLYDNAKQLARHLSDRRLYDLAVEQNRPKNELQYLMQVIGKANLLNNLNTGLAVWSANGKTGDMAAAEAASEQYRQDGHKILNVAGTVAGMALDPTMWISAGVGGLATKGVLNLGGRFIAGAGASAGRAAAATRLFGSTMTGRLIGGIAGSAATMGTFEGMKEMENQFAHGGHIVGTDDEGRYVNEGYSGWAVGGSILHGLGMGAAIGWLGPVFGNVSDKLVSGGEILGKSVSGVSSTAGKVATRAGMYTGATVLEGTIFSVPEWIEGQRDGLDIWSDNMAMMVGFKAKHMLKSAGGVLGDLKASFDSPTNGKKNRLDFESRLRQRMDAPSDGGLALTEDEKAELKKYGYDLMEIVESSERTGNPAEGGLIAKDAPEIVSRLTDMVRDTRISEAARAKMYYYATGRRLPMSTVMRGELVEDGNGGFIVESIGANGVITSRSFKDRKAADLELSRINRQTELNHIEIGERYQQTVDAEKRLQDACRTVAEENGWNPLEVYRVCEDARRNHLRGVKKEYSEAEQNILNKVVEAVGEFKETEVTDIMRGDINEKYGVDIDKAIRKEANRRTQAEQTAIDEYLGELIPEKAKENKVEDAEAEDITNQKLLRDESEPQTPFDEQGPIDPRFDNSEAGPDYDPHKPQSFGNPDDPYDPMYNQPLGRATMKYKDRQVEVVSGRVVMMEDGTMVDNERSDNSIVIRDMETGELEMVSPDAILTYEEYPQPTAEAAPEAAAPAEGTEAAPVSNYTEGKITIRNSDGSETRGYLTGYVDEQGRHEYYIEGNLNELHYASDWELDNMLADFTPIKPAEPEPQPEAAPEAAPAPQSAEEQVIHGSMENLAEGLRESMDEEIERNGLAWLSNPKVYAILTEYGKGCTSIEELAERAKADSEDERTKQRIDNLLKFPSTRKQLEHILFKAQGNEEAVPNSAESVPNSAQNPEIPTETPQNPAESVPNAPVSVENVQQPAAPEPTPLQKLPRDADGEPIFEKAATPEEGWDALVEYRKGDKAKAKAVADIMVDLKRKEFEKLQKQKPKGKTVKEISDSQDAIDADLARVEAEYNHWERMSRVEQNREFAIRSQQEAENRRLAEERRAQEAEARAAKEEQERIEREALEGIPEWHLDNPENARKRGSRRFSGQLFTRQEPVNGVVGRETEVKFSNSDIPHGHYVVMDAAELQPSHIQGTRNPMFFIDEAQPKNRAEAVSAHSAREIATNIRPKEIAESETAYTGAPVVNSRGETIQGHNRSDALLYLWNNSLPEQQNIYKQTVIDNADRLGLNPEEVAAMEKPVLVRMLDVEDAEAIRLGQLTAQDTESGGIERIKPKNIAQKLGDDMRTFANLLLRSPDEEASFGQLVDRNGMEVIKWMSQVGAITDTQYRSAFDSKGNLTAEAKNDLQKVLYQAIFKGANEQLEEMFENVPAKAQRAILSTAFRDMDSPFAGKMLPELQSSIVAYNLLMNDPVFSAAKKMSEVLPAIEAFKAQISLDDRFEQHMPADNFSNFALHLAAMFKASDMSQSTLTKYFNDMYDLAQGKKEATLFEEADTTQYPLADVIRKVLNIDYKPAKNGNNVIPDGGADVALRNQGSQGGEPRGNEPPAGGEPVEAGAEPSDNRAGAADVSGAEQSIDELVAKHGRIQLKRSYPGEHKENGTFVITSELENKRIAYTLHNLASDNRTTDFPDFLNKVHQVFNMTPGVVHNGTLKAFYELARAKKITRDEARQYFAFAPGHDKETPEPTEAQKEAGNYKMEHRRVDGHNISIENPKGSIRRGTDKDGKAWETEMQNDYGYIRGTEGVDGDHIDVFLSDNPEEGDVFVVDQINPETGEFDEHKVMYGFPDVESAKAAYLSNYDKGWKGLGAITHVTKDEFKKWIKSSHRKTKPFADYKAVKAITQDIDQTRTNITKDGLVADAEGYPMKLYHGTPNPDIKSLSDLEPGHTRIGEDAPVRFNGGGISFSPDPMVAEDYTQADGGVKGKVFECHVRLQKPYYTAGVANFTPEEAQEFTDNLIKQGYDGIINYPSTALRMNGYPNEIIAFDKKCIIPVEKEAAPAKPAAPADPLAELDGKEDYIDQEKKKLDEKGINPMGTDALAEEAPKPTLDFNTGFPNMPGVRGILGYTEVQKACIEVFTKGARDKAGEHMGDIFSGKDYTYTYEQYEADMKEELTEKKFAEVLPTLREIYNHLTSTLESAVDARQKAKREAPKPAESAPAEPKTIEAEGYTIEPRKDTRDNSDLFAVKFEERVSKEEFKGQKAIAKRHNGYWSNFGKKGFLFKTEADAQAFAKEIMGKSEDDVADEAPLSMADIKPAAPAKPAKPVEEKKPEPAPEAPKPKKKRRWISDDDAAEFDNLRNDLRSHLGADDNIAHEEAASYGKPQPKQMDAEVLRLGTRMTYLMMKGGLRKFSDYAEAMVDEVGDAIRPHLKSLYAAAQNMEEVMQLGWDEEMDDRKTVKAFDVYNFDKAGAVDIIETAQHIVDETQSQQKTDEIVQSLKVHLTFEKGPG